IDACRRTGMRFLLTGHEASAAWMAQVLGQITGVPGVCASTLGPGATNLVTGIANAFLDRAPCVAVTAQISNSSFETMTHQRPASQALFARIPKGSSAIEDRDPAAAPEHALPLAAAPRPGPVHLSLASDAAGRESGAGAFACHIPEQRSPVDPVRNRLAAATR